MWRRKRSHAHRGGRARGWQDECGSQGLQVAGIALAAAIAIGALLLSFNSVVLPTAHQAMDCANAALSGLSGCASGDAAVQQAFSDANAALGVPAPGTSGMDAASGGGSQVADAASGADSGAASAPAWWHRVTQWFGQQWQDVQEAGAQVWGWLKQGAVWVGFALGVLAAALAAVAAAVVGAPVLVVAGLVFVGVAIISGTVYANRQHAQLWHTNLLKHLGIGALVGLTALGGWALEAGLATIVSASVAAVAAAVSLTALLNKARGQRWDKGLLLNLGLALATLGAGAVLRGAQGADPPPVVQSMDDVADAAPEVHPVLPCGGVAPTRRAPGLGAPLVGSCLELMQQRVAELRQTLSIGKGRNVAVANVDLPQMADEVVGVSGEALRTGTVPSPSHRFFSTTVDEFPRDFDAEVKVLEYIAHRYADAPGVYPDVRGTITLFTERPPCQSCSGVIEQFQLMFPNIKVNVLFNP